MISALEKQTFEKELDLGFRRVFFEGSERRGRTRK